MTNAILNIAVLVQVFGSALIFMSGHSGAAILGVVILIGGGILFRHERKKLKAQSMPPTGQIESPRK